MSEEFSILPLTVEKMLHYRHHFMGTGPLDLEKVEKVKNKLLGVHGVVKVEITLPKRVSVTYDPTKVPPSVISSIMSNFGLKPSG